jgi:hypothetical protein
MDFLRSVIEIVMLDSFFGKKCVNSIDYVEIIANIFNKLYLNAYGISNTKKLPSPLGTMDWGAFCYIVT